MIDENEAFKAGLAIAVIMLASGFSMLFVPTYTGDGAVVLSLGVMTMVLVLMIRVLVSQIQGWMDYNARIEETVSEILTFQQSYPPEQALPKKQIEFGEKQKPKEME